MKMKKDNTRPGKRFCYLERNDLETTEIYRISNLFSTAKTTPCLTFGTSFAPRPHHDPWLRKTRDEIFMMQKLNLHEKHTSS